MNAYEVPNVVVDSWAALHLLMCKGRIMSVKKCLWSLIAAIAAAGVVAEASEYTILTADAPTNDAYLGWSVAVSADGDTVVAGLPVSLSAGPRWRGLCIQAGCRGELDRNTTDRRCPHE